MSDETTKASKFLSYVLRHNPTAIGITLDANGWVAIDDLLARLATNGHPLTREQLQHVVDTNNKQRFAVSDDRLQIRANQGHSTNVDLDLPPVEPPRRLYHGTSRDAVPSIRDGGLKPGTRRHVHLSFDAETARRVGARHGPPVVLVVDAHAMHAAGLAFRCSVNGVWLTDHVPAEYIHFPDAKTAGSLQCP